MNILFVSNKSVYSGVSVGGAETSMAVMAEEAAKLGHGVIYVASDKKLALPFEKKMINQVTVIHYRPLRIKTFGFPVLRRMSRYLKQQHQRRFYHSVINQYKIDFIYSFGTVSYELLKLKEHKQLHFKLMHRVAGVTKQDENTVADPVKIARSEYGYKNADAINFQSVEHKSSYLQIATNVQRMSFRTFIHDIGIHPSFFEKRPAGKEDSEFRLICVMRFSERKRQDILIEALQQLRHIPVSLTLIGDGPTQKNAENLVKKNKLETQIAFKGFLSREKLQQELANADLYCHPVDYEPQSKALWEAMAAGIPVLASDVQTVNTLIEEKVNGFLCRNQPSEWADSINQLFNQQDKLKQVACKAKNRVLQLAHPSVNIHAYLKEFDHCITA